MTGVKLASRYSRSLLLLALERGEVDRIFEDMRLLAEVCAENRDFVIMLRSPIIKTDRKKTIFRELFAGKISETTLTFFEILATKKRENFLEKIAEEFVVQYKENKKITTATVTTTMKLDDEMKLKILSLIKNQTMQDVDLIEQVDEKLIGGFVLRVGDTQVDASILRKLNDLKKSFKENPYVKEF